MELTTYKGYPILVDENGNFHALHDGKVQFETTTLAELKEHVDKFTKVAFKRQEAYVYGYGKWEKGTITGLLEEQRYDKTIVYEYRVSHGKSWSKESAASLYKVSPANDALLSEMADLRKSMDQLRDRYSAKEMLMEPWTDSELIPQAAEGAQA